MSFVATTASQIPTRAARPLVSRPGVSARTVRPSPRMVRLFADPATNVEKAIEEAQEVCKDGTEPECATAWDTVEELAADAAHKKEASAAAKKDPLEEYCESAPDADECRVYED